MAIGTGADERLPALHVGDFVWTNFAIHEAPAKPGPEHLAYVVVIKNLGDGALFALVAYTTSTGLDFETLPRGVHAFGLAEAQALGQSKAFRLDLRRLARLPVTEAWFPRLVEATHGVIGRATKRQRTSLRADLDVLVARHRDLMEKTGGPG